MAIELKGDVPLANDLRRLSRVRFDAVLKKNMTQILTRGKEEGGTPVSTEATRPGGPHGELKGSLGMSGRGESIEVGYTKDYAPHVEFGHRTVNGGFVQGQHFLKRNVDKQRPIFIKDLRNQLRRFG